MVLKINLYIKELILFGVAMFLGIVSANRLSESGVALPGPGKFELTDLIIVSALLVALLLYLLFLNCSWSYL